jgi:GABA permease
MDWKTSVLVVANVTAASDELLAVLTERAGEGPAEFTLLLPATGGDRAGAERALDRALERMRDAGLEVSGSIGDRDPVVAVHEAWDPRRYDEVVVSTLPTGASRWLQIDLPHRIERMTDVPVRHVVAKPPPKPRPTYTPPPKPEHHGLLTPLEALGWGGKGQGEDRPARR